MLIKTCFIAATSFLIVGCNQGAPEVPSEAETASEGDDHHGHDEPEASEISDEEEEVAVD